MRQKQKADRRCTYVVVIDAAIDLRSFADYLSFLGSNACDVIVFDATATLDPVRRLAAFGAEVFSAFDLFVKRRPPQLGEWIRERPRAAGDDFAMPVKTAFFFMLIPMAMLLLVFGGVRVAVGFTSAVAFASIVLALRGRAGASAFFPLR